jgi:DNA-binding Lrp family transcriptional regulator
MNLEEIKNRIVKLDQNEYSEIFKIIVNNEEKYTKNNNGYFINLTFCSNKTIQSVAEFLNFIDENKKYIQSVEDKMDTDKTDIDNKSFNQTYKTIENKKIICHDYSPFITLDEPEIVNLNELIVDEIEIVAVADKSTLEDEFNETENDLNELIHDIDGVENDNTTVNDNQSSLVESSKKKKKIVGNRARIVKKIKNMNSVDCSEDIGELGPDGAQTELMCEEEFK